MTTAGKNINKIRKKKNVQLFCLQFLNNTTIAKKRNTSSSALILVLLKKILNLYIPWICLQNNPSVVRLSSASIVDASSKDWRGLGLDHRGDNAVLLLEDIILQSVVNLTMVISSENIGAVKGKQE